MATKMCCGKPMMVIKANAGILRQGFDNEMPEPPVILYKCVKCGKVIDADDTWIYGEEIDV